MKHLLVLEPEYNKRHPEKEKWPQSYEYWLNIVLLARDDLKVDKVEFLVFGNESYQQKIEDRLKGIDVEKRKTDHGNFMYSLKIDDYIAYLKAYDHGCLYNDFYEDPKLLSGSKVIVETVSHEYHVYFHVSGDRIDNIESKLKLKFLS